MKMLISNFLIEQTDLPIIQCYLLNLTLNTLIILFLFPQFKYLPIDFPKYNDGIRQSVEIVESYFKKRQIFI